MRWSLAMSILVAAACGGSKHVVSPKPQVTTVQNVAAPPHTNPSDPSTWQGEAARWEPDVHDWIMAMLKELRVTGERDGPPRLVEFVDRVTALVQQVDDGQLTREQLLEAFHAAEQQVPEPIGDKIEEKLDDLREAMRDVKRVPRDK